MTKKLRWAAVILIALAAAALAAVQCWTWSPISPEDTIRITRIERVVWQDFDDEPELLAVPLDGGVREDVTALLCAQRCRGLTWNPYPMALADGQWEIDCMINNVPGYHFVYANQSVFYCANPNQCPFPLYFRLQDGAGTAAALADLKVPAAEEKTVIENTAQEIIHKIVIAENEHDWDTYVSLLSTDKQRSYQGFFANVENKNNYAGVFNI